MILDITTGATEWYSINRQQCQHLFTRHLSYSSQVWCTQCTRHTLFLASLICSSVVLASATFSLISSATRLLSSSDSMSARSSVMSPSAELSLYSRSSSSCRQAHSSQSALHRPDTLLVITEMDSPVKLLHDSAASEKTEMSSLENSPSQHQCVGGPYVGYTSCL
jgi:hypothetical protein